MRPLDGYNGAETMCGIAAVLLADSSGDVNTMLFDALTVLQHRGQDAAGMVTCELSPPHRLHLRKDNGLVKDVFTQQHMLELVGPMGLAHARYPTAGSSSCAEAQPLYTNYPCGVCIAHNGNLTNTAELAAELTRNMRHVNTDSDSEMLVNIFAHALADAVKRRRDDAAARGALDAETADFVADDVFAAVRGVMAKCRGGYSVVMLVNKLGLVAFRDPHGIRPVVYGRRAHAAEGAGATQAAEGPLYDHAFMSESVAFDALGFELVREPPRRARGDGGGVAEEAEAPALSLRCATSRRARRWSSATASAARRASCTPASAATRAPRACARASSSASSRPSPYRARARALRPPERRAAHARASPPGPPLSLPRARARARFPLSTQGTCTSRGPTR